jgi:hypothetical protein
MTCHRLSPPKLSQKSLKADQKGLTNQAQASDEANLNDPKQDRECAATTPPNQIE